MPFSRRRFVLSAVILVSLIILTASLRLTYEWRQALDDIDSMIVTPVAITLPTDGPISGGVQSSPSHAQPQTNVAGSDLLSACLLYTSPSPRD